MTHKTLFNSLMILGLCGSASGNSLPLELSNPYLIIDTDVAQVDRNRVEGNGWSGKTRVMDEVGNIAEMQLVAYGTADADYVEVSWMNQGVEGWTSTGAVLEFTVARDVMITFEGVVSTRQSPFNIFPSLSNESGGQQLYNFNSNFPDSTYALEAGVSYRLALHSQYTPNIQTSGESVVWRFRIGDPAQPCPADLDGDGQVDGADLMQLLSLWGSTDTGSDLNGDGNVDAADLTVLLGKWGNC